MLFIKLISSDKNIDNISQLEKVKAIRLKNKKNLFFFHCKRISNKRNNTDLKNKSFEYGDIKILHILDNKRITAKTQ